MAEGPRSGGDVERLAAGDCCELGPTFWGCSSLALAPISLGPCWMRPVRGSRCLAVASLTVLVMRLVACCSCARTEEMCPATGVREFVDDGVVVPELSSWWGNRIGNNELYNVLE